MGAGVLWLLTVVIDAFGPFVFAGAVVFVCLRDGGTAALVMDQLHATLQALAKPPATSGGGGGGGGTVAVRCVKDALLLALRGVSLSGGSIGAEEASTFRRVRHAHVA